MVVSVTPAGREFVSRGLVEAVAEPFLFPTGLSPCFVERPSIPHFCPRGVGGGGVPQCNIARWAGLGNRGKGKRGNK